MAKKQRLKRTKRFAKRIFAFDENKQNYGYLKFLFGRAFENESGDGSAEDFKALNIDAERLARIKANIKKQLSMYAIIAVLVVMAFIYELTQGNFFASILALAFLVALAAVSFRSHFWLFQLNQEKIGCSFEQWANHTFKRGRS